MKASVIVPVFNARETLGRCLDSLLAQTMRKIEIVCVDDGSTDGSADLLRSFAARDRRIVALFQDNHGVEWARAEALDHATGDVVLFCDSDDEFEPSMCERMVGTMERDGVDLVVCGTKLVGGFPELYVRDKEKSDLTQVSPLDLHPEDSLWNKAFRRSLIRETGLRFPRSASIRRGFDACFCLCYSIAAKTASTMSEKLIVHYRREGSLQSLRRSFRLRSTLDIVQALPLALDFMDRNELWEKGRERFFGWFDILVRICFEMGFPKERELGVRLAGEALSDRIRDIPESCPWLLAAARRDPSFFSAQFRIIDRNRRRMEIRNRIAATRAGKLLRRLLAGRKP